MGHYVDVSDTSQTIVSSASYATYSVDVTDSLGCTARKLITSINATDLYAVDADSVCVNDTLSFVPKNISPCNEVTLTGEGATTTNVSTLFSFDQSG